ncbi:hypothetical protein IAD21_00680 [Abditibacteriota bacterium]|nr:hypothetical protein IAD21_00680 [Abditibacteriota bacterium]
MSTNFHGPSAEWPFAASLPYDNDLHGYPSYGDTSWTELRQLAESAGVSIEHLCQTVESATHFARASKGIPFTNYNDDLEAVIRTLADDDDFNGDFDLETKTRITPQEWNEWQHPRDELGRFTGSGIHTAAHREHHYDPLSDNPEGDSRFWGENANRDAATRQHFNGKFEVDIPLNESATIDHLSHQMFGRTLEPHEWGELIGAPDGEKLEVRALPRAVLVQINPEMKSPLLVSLMREARLGDAHGVDLSITAHLVDAVIKKQGDAPKGLAPRMLGYSIRKCQNLGIKTIISEAVGNRYASDTIGYKHWPLMGFDADLKATDRSKLAAIAPRFRAANTILDLYQMPDGKAAWAQIGTGRKMYFDTTLNSKSHQVFSAYLKEKGIEL